MGLDWVLISWGNYWVHNPSPIKRSSLTVAEQPRAIQGADSENSNDHAPGELST